MTCIMFSKPFLIYTKIMFKTAIVLTAFILTALPSRAADAPMFPACNECHSKNPKMVRMHSALGFKGCFTCHGPAKELPVKERINERASDERCVPCHKQ